MKKPSIYTKDDKTALLNAPFLLTYHLLTLAKSPRIKRFLAITTIFFTLCLISSFLLPKVFKFTCPKIAEANDLLLVPNVVHFIHFDAPLLPFASFICILAAFYNQDPDKIAFHTNVPHDQLISQPLWERLVAIIGPRLVLHSAHKPTHVYGQEIGNIWHAMDIFRLQIAYTHGGIFLDQDTFVVQSLDTLRKFEGTLGWALTDEFFGTQCILAKPNATFIKLWLQSYQDYRPELWYYNAGEYPTYILKQCPHLVHFERKRIGVQNLANELYGFNWSGWRDYYAIHLLINHRYYLVEDDVNVNISDFDEVNILTYDRTFGEMARSILTRIEEDNLSLTKAEKENINEKETNEEEDEEELSL